ncbi:alpha/beta fold hydrolase [Bordetella hinzii]|uniref:alpha/beta fold hydrolase n=1 Tax=Bordetella hinzii TaxID=103855 RepID=UPI000406EEFF|nr:alpha/beta fold hydrolase [Bordetella hinzii]AKQ55016.1 Dihydrolipoyllysine-residue acetyltransferase component of acetoin cleaving system [Bordetella hinzii]KCB23975.1 putative lysophospholipase [Bordetella hinzii L60]KCB33658.1 putative lysophospholipase [Bordetella hinzii CA90 BAL1384]KCB44686.1 putative lysophospholipase [Bordetella hinzii 4161]KCB50816.1 putative lysophospholipase [Bordetella hinzii 1277]
MGGPIQYFADAGGINVRVRQWGHAGPAVLCVHGLGSHAEIWDELGARLAAQGRVCLAIDLPGHGLSYKGPDFDYRAAGHAAMLARLLDSLGQQAVDVVGSSLGGLHAAAFATTHPARARSLALIGAVGLAPLAPQRREWTAGYLARMDRDAVAERLRAGVYDPARVSEAYIEETWRMNNSAGAAESFAAIGRYYLGSINDDIQTDRLAALGERLPLMLIWGEDDVTVSYADARQAAARLPRARFEALPRTRHIPHVERPDEVARLLSQHLSAVSTTVLESA